MLSNNQGKKQKKLSSLNPHALIRDTLRNKELIRTFSTDADIRYRNTIYQLLENSYDEIISKSTRGEFSINVRLPYYRRWDGVYEFHEKHFQSLIKDPMVLIMTQQNANISWNPPEPEESPSPDASEEESSEEEHVSKKRKQPSDSISVNL